MAIRDEPHVAISADELAKWVEGKGDQWWIVDGDPLLTARIAFPCPGDKLAAAVRRVGRQLLVRDRRTPPTGRGQEVTAEVLDQVASTLASAVQVSGPAPSWSGDLLLDLAWRDSGIDWLLTEDSESAAVARGDATAGAA